VNTLISCVLIIYPFNKNGKKSTCLVLTEQTRTARSETTTS